jgi:hypothetical protein
MKPCAKVLCSLCGQAVVAMSEESMKAAAYDHLTFAHARIRPFVKGEYEPNGMAGSTGGECESVCTTG